MAGKVILVVPLAHIGAGFVMTSVFVAKLFAFKNTPASHFWSYASAIAILIL